MADNSNNISTRLQQHGIEPPADAFAKAWQAIVQQEAAGDNIEMPAEKKIFSQLQEHTIPAPGFDFDVISGKKSKRSVHLLPAAWIRAASVILILTVGGIFYFNWSNKKTPVTNSVAASSSPDTVHQVANRNFTDTFKKGETLNDTPAAIIAMSSNSIEKGQTQPALKNGLTPSRRKAGTVKINNNNGEARLYENDLLLTLVNYKAQDWQQFFTKAVTDKKITLNKYSYHNLSDNMVAMLQDMYLVKSSGKPTRKARKTKKKFEKWRSKDEKYFDKDLQKNPSDIIDLSEFILKNN